MLKLVKTTPEYVADMRDIFCAEFARKPGPVEFFLVTLHRFMFLHNQIF